MLFPRRRHLVSFFGGVIPNKMPFLTDFQVSPDYMSLDESEPEAPVSKSPKKKTSKKEASQKTSDSPKVADKEPKTTKASDSPKPKKTPDEKESESKKSKDKKKSLEKVEAIKDAKKAEKKTPAASVAEVKSTKDEEKDDSSSDSDSEDGGAKVESTKGKSTNNTGPNRPARRRLMLIDRQKIKIQKRLGVEEGSTEPNEEVDKALEEWTKNFDELNAKSVKKQAAKAKKALKRRNDNHKRTTKGMTTKQLEKIHQRRAAKNQTKFDAPAA